MDFVRLIQHGERLFPGARAPMLDKRKSGGIKGLCELLASTEELEFTSTEVEKVTGIVGKKLASAFNATKVQAVAEARGWGLIKGRGRFNPSRLVRKVAI